MFCVIKYFLKKKSYRTISEISIFQCFAYDPRKSLDLKYCCIVLCSVMTVTDPHDPVLSDKLRKMTATGRG